MLSLETFWELVFLYKKNQIKKYGYKKVFQAIFKSYLISKRISIFLTNNISKKEKETVLYSYWLSDTAVSISKFKEKGFNGKVISRCHAYEIRDNKFYLPFRNSIEKEINEIHFISQYTQTEYERIINSLQIRGDAEYHLSRLGIDLPTNINNYKKKSNEILIVSCSNVIQLKRLDLIINALALMDEGFQLKWIHFGDGEFLEEIKKDALLKLKNKENVSYEFRGHTQNEEVLKFYKENLVSLFINLSDIEGVPVSIMEAMSYGIPCIARDVGGNSEIIKNGKNGILLKSNATSIEIANAISNFIQQSCNQIEMEKIKKNCLSTCKKKFYASKNYNVFYENLSREL